MTQDQIKEINKNVSYNEGKIFFSLNIGYTSLLMKKLQESYNYKTVKQGTIHILYDNKGRKVTRGCTWVELLYNTSIVMR